MSVCFYIWQDCCYIWQNKLVTASLMLINLFVYDLKLDELIRSILADS